MSENLADFYSDSAEGYEELWAPELLKLSLPFVDRLPLDKATSVVDVGAGVGVMAAEMASRAPRTLVVAVDLAEGMIARTPPGPATAVMDARRLGFGATTFDIVTLPFMLFHVDDPGAVMREAARVVNPGGTVGTITWGEDPSFLALEIWADELDAHGAGQTLPVFSRHDLVNTEAKVRALFEAAGLHVATTWMGLFEFQMTPDEFIRHRIGRGMSRRRFLSLAPEVRPAFLESLRSRLEQLGPKALTDRTEVIYAIGENHVSRTI